MFILQSLKSIPNIKYIDLHVSFLNKNLLLLNIFCRFKKKILLLSFFKLNDNGFHYFFLYQKLQPVDMDFVSSLITCQKTRDIHVTYGKVCLKPATGDEDSTMYIKGDPVTVMFEFTRMKAVDVLDLFITFDTDGSHSVTWEEFKEGVQVIICKRLSTFLWSMLNTNLRKQINFLSLFLKEKT